MGKSERPEHTAPPEIFYNADEARKYTTNSRIMQIQVAVDRSYSLLLYFRIWCRGLTDLASCTGKLN